MARFFACILFLMMPLQAMAGVRMYLAPTVEMKKDMLRFNDIARFEGPPAVIATLRELAVPEKLCRDGLVDRREIVELFASYTDEDIEVLGSAVRLVQKSADRIVKTKPFDEGDISVKNGDRVTVVIRNGSITIRVQGTSLESGRQGDRVMVRVNSQRIKGRLAGRSTVEVTM